MLDLDRASRTALAGASLLAFAAAFATLPSAARGAATPASTATATPAASAAFIRPMRHAIASPVALRRDPFSGGTLVASNPVALPLRGVNAADIAPPMPPPNLPQPPRAPTAPSAARPRVTAIVAGPRPSALIDDAGTTRIVTLGDIVRGVRIVAIHIDGVHLADGTTLAVTPFLEAHDGGT